MRRNKNYEVSEKTAFVLIMFAVILALLAATMVRAFEVFATISLSHSGGRYGLAYDSNMGEVFVANGDTDSVYVISDSSNSVVATVPVGRSRIAWLMIRVSVKYSLPTITLTQSQRFRIKLTPWLQISQWATNHAP